MVDLQNIATNTDLPVNQCVWVFDAPNNRWVNQLIVRMDLVGVADGSVLTTAEGGTAVTAEAKAPIILSEQATEAGRMLVANGLEFADTEVAVILRGTSAPTGADGFDGAYWLNTTSGLMYGPRGSVTPGAWPTKTISFLVNDAGVYQLPGSTNIAGNTLYHKGWAKAITFTSFAVDDGDPTNTANGYIGLELIVGAEATGWVGLRPIGSNITQVKNIRIGGHNVGGVLQDFNGSRYMTEGMLANDEYTTLEFLATEGYIRQADLDADGYVTQSDLDAAVYIKQSDLDTDGYITQTDLDTAEYITQTDLDTDAYIKQADLDADGYVSQAVLDARPFLRSVLVNTFACTANATNFPTYLQLDAASGFHEINGSISIAATTYSHLVSTGPDVYDDADATVIVIGEAGRYRGKIRIMFNNTDTTKPVILYTKFVKNGSLFPVPGMETLYKGAPNCSLEVRLSFDLEELAVDDEITVLFYILNSGSYASTFGSLGTAYTQIIVERVL